MHETLYAIACPAGATHPLKDALCRLSHLDRKTIEAYLVEARRNQYVGPRFERQ